MATNLSPEFQPWTMSDAFQRKERSRNRETSMYLEPNEKFQFPSPVEDSDSKMEEKPNSVFDERYMSSEEALSPMQPESDYSDAESFSDLADEDFDDEDFYRATVSSGDLAIVVSIIQVGRPKVVDVPYPSPASSLKGSHPPSRSSSLQKDLQLQQELTPQPQSLETRFSAATVRPQTPPTPRPSIERHSPVKRFSLGSLSRTPSGSKKPLNPSVAMTSSPDFLNYDPMEMYSPFPRDTQEQPLPARSRMRSFSRSISFARRALGSNKKGDTKDAKSSKEAQYEASFSTASPSTFSSTMGNRAPQKLIPRGADEIEPTIELPPFPDDDEMETLEREGRFDFPPRAPRRRKSLSLLGMG